MASNNSSTPAPLPEDAGGNVTPNISVVPEPRPRSAPGMFNKRQILQLDRCDLVTAAALKYQAQLVDEGIEVADVNALVADTVLTRRRARSAVSHTKAKEGATGRLGSTRRELMRELRRAQAKAKNAYQFSSPGKLADYHVGEPINTSRPLLEQTSQDIIDQTNTDRPSNVDTNFINRMQNARTAWINARNAQTNEKSDAKTVRSQRDAEVASITDRRIQIQLAADAHWPAGVAANAGIRGEFLLEPNRALNA